MFGRHRVALVICVIETFEIPGMAWYLLSSWSVDPNWSYL